MYDPHVYLYKTVLMQRLLDSVSRGYPWHTSGTVPLHKAQRFVEKFADRYSVDRNENQRAYARRKGKANARLFMFVTHERTELLWWLLASKGIGVVHEQEQLWHAMDKRRRIRIGNDYELIRRTRSSTNGGGTVWSWRMTRACYENWRRRIILACRSPGTAEIRPAISSLFRTPGFSGTRKQVGELCTLARKEWRRRHGSLDHFPTLPKLKYVERMTETKISLSQLIIGIKE